jgi:hypothetical protein
VTLRPALPFLTLVTAIVATLAAPQVAALGAAAYALGAAIEAVRVSRREGAPAAITWLAFPAMHFPHGAGFGVGLVRFLLWPNWTSPQPDRRRDVTPLLP